MPQNKDINFTVPKLKQAGSKRWLTAVTPQQRVCRAGSHHAWAWHQVWHPCLFSQWSFVVATITEIPPVIFLPNFLVQRKVLRPLRTQTGGTIMVGWVGCAAPDPRPTLPCRVLPHLITI